MGLFSNQLAVKHVAGLVFPFAEDCSISISGRSVIINYGNMQLTIPDQSITNVATNTNRSTDIDYDYSYGWGIVGALATGKWWGAGLGIKEKKTKTVESHLFIAYINEFGVQDAVELATINNQGGTERMCRQIDSLRASATQQPRSVGGTDMLKNSSTDPDDTSSDLNEQDDELEELSEEITIPGFYQVVDKAKIYADGKYKVGVDIPAGEYLIISPEGTQCYFEVKDSSRADAPIAFNAYDDNHAYAGVKSGQYIKTNESVITPAENITILKIKDGAYPAGEYKVGKDIPAGEYALKLIDKNDQGYYEVKQSCFGNKILSNELFDTKTYVTVAEGQFLKAKNAKLYPC